MTFPNRNQSGSGTYARSLFAALRARDDVRTVAISAAPGTNFAGTLNWLVRGAGTRLSTNPTSLLHCPTFVTPWNLPVPFVTTVLDLSTRRFPQDFPLEWRAYERWVVPSRARAAALVLAISEVTRRDAIAEYGVQPDRVVTIPPGIDKMFFAPEQRPPYSPPFRLLFPGAPVARKNFELVLHCLAKAPAGSATAAAELEISGAVAESFPAVDALIRSLGLTPRVHWLGLVKRNEMPLLMARAAAVLYPSFYEGFGLPPLEAMAHGTPVLTSNTSSIPEVVGNAAVMVNPENVFEMMRALQRVLLDQSLREKLRQRGYEQVTKFSWDASAAKVLAGYEEAVGKSGTETRMEKVVNS